MKLKEMPRLQLTFADWLQLIRPRLSAMVALAALSGYLAAPGSADAARALPLLLGVFLVTAAASTLNQLQERARDRLLPRTRMRPLASGRTQPHQALALAALHLVTGLQLLVSVSHAAFAVGFLAIVWYNLVYTPLKARTSLALLLGALGGGLPPVLGWVASGASPLEPRAVHLYLLLFLWQVPHFWCLALKDSLAARECGLQLLPADWTSHDLIRMVRLWGLALGALLLSAVPVTLVDSFLVKGLLTALAIWGSFGLAGTGDHSDPLAWAHATGRRLHHFLAASLLLLTLDPFLPC